MHLEYSCLLIVECLEVAISGVLSKPAQCLRSGINGRLAVTLGFLQISKILALDSFIFWAVLLWFLIPISSHGLRWVHTLA